MAFFKKSLNQLDSHGNLKIIKEDLSDRVIALAGNPNVGKSTVFNNLTGMKQHTGNWPGKTVVNAQGRYKYNNKNFILVDIPGTYSLAAISPEEGVARDFLCFGEADAIAVVLDATCLERNLNLLLQILEVRREVVLCVNLLDEAQKKGIRIDLPGLSRQLAIPVVGCKAAIGEGLDQLMAEIDKISVLPKEFGHKEALFSYGEDIEEAIHILQIIIRKNISKKLDSRWLALRLLDMDDSLALSLAKYLGRDILDENNIKENGEILTALAEVKKVLAQKGYGAEKIKDKISEAILFKAEEIYQKTVGLERADYNHRDRKIDKILTSKTTGIPLMLLLLAMVFWLTIVGANYPSQLLSSFFFWLEGYLTKLFVYIQAPAWFYGILVLGIYRTLTWVISVMLPPMAIFFPLFTLLEDSGYLPRVAFNLDKFFKRACAHGKQSLTMCMGFGCNACGVMGCRIIDSPRERMIAIITNNFVPCNGRFPTLIALITMFFVNGQEGLGGSLLGTVFLTALILLGILMTLLVSRILSHTILKGLPSSFTLELPPYRKPQIRKVILRSIFDRTIFVLGRAVVVAAPAGLIIWLLANINLGELSLLAYCADFLDPLAYWLGLDGVILLAFILGFPANEIVLPIIIMTYLSTGSLLEMGSLSQLRDLLVNNGWTWLTALCTMLFSLLHFPCGTTCWTIKKESGSWLWTMAAFLIPTVTGLLVCFLVANISRLLGLV